jgi:hypothetical protein
MIRLIIFLMVINSITVSGQNVKEQIGTSVWIKDNKIVADSTIALKLSFDKQNRKTREWQLYRDTLGIILDTNYAEVDTAGRVLHFYGGKEHWYWQYDSLGNELESIAYRKEDTLIFNYELSYDKKGRVINRTSKFNGEFYSSPTNFKYKKHITIQNDNNLVITTTKRNEANQIISIETITDYINHKSVQLITYRFDKEGKLILYTKMKDGNTLKQTSHFYKDQIEEYQIEQFYNPNYKIITYFTYEYYE